MNLVITMSRRFGTGASIIAKELSERLHIPVYDKDDVEHGMRENAFESEADAIRELAKQPCIIIGRCASEFLKDKTQRHQYLCLRGQRGPDQTYHEAVFPDKRGG